MKKHIGFIGLGRMGRNMVHLLLDKGYKVTVYNRDSSKTKKISKHKNIIPSYSFDEFMAKITKQRVIWIMVTAGKPVDEIIKGLAPFLATNDIIIDGGNSHYEDSIKRYNELKKHGINFLDAGVSGGVERARHGSATMVGGKKEVFKKTESLFRDLSEKNGYGYMGASGAGHFVKIIHNSIEYGLLESYAEGFEILEKSKYDFNFEEIARTWSNGSIIESRITKLAESAFKKSPNLKKFTGKIGGGETGSWGLKIANMENVEAKTLSHAISKRKKSMRKQTFSTKFVAALRKEFGGHKEPK